MNPFDSDARTTIMILSCNVSRMLALMQVLILMFVVLHAAWEPGIEETH